MNPLAKMKKEIELEGIKLGLKKMTLNRMEREEDIKRINADMEIQKAKIEELESELLSA